MKLIIKNVRRRLYDALNVMISAGILEKYAHLIRLGSDYALSRDHKLITSHETNLIKQ